jgi:glycosyltransferase involved in cell wall biosynthesis
MRSPDIQARSVERSVDAQDRRLRVVTLVDGIGTYGGGESLAREIVLRLDPDRFDRVFCVSRWDPVAVGEQAALDAAAELESNGVRFIGLERHGRPALRPWKLLIDELRSHPADVLHSHKHGSNAWGALFKRIGRVPVFVAHEHTWSFEGRPARKFLDRNLIGRAATRVVAVSNADRQKMIELEGLPPDKVVMIPNGIPDPITAPGAGVAVRDELGIAHDAPVIGTVATIRPQKALEVLIEATAALRERFPDAATLIAGGDVGGSQLRDELTARAAALGVTENVRFLGLREDVPAVIDALDVAVCCSDFEGSPLSVMEYMEGARPVVATDVGGLGDLIGDGVHGYLVGPRDSAALADRIGALLGDPELARKLGEAGRERRRAEFSIDATAARVGALYEELCREH